MVKIIRKIFVKNKLMYYFLATIYHFISNMGMAINCYIRGIYFFFPRHPTGQYNSQFGQDYYIELLNLIDDKSGIFVEVGCNDPIFNSNSFYFESRYGYTGISIDAIDFSEKYRDLRPKTNFINCVIDDVNEFVDFHFVENQDGWENQVSSVYIETVKMSKGFNAITKKIKAKKLSDICSDCGAIDLFLIDVEGHEINVLNSFDWIKNCPRVVLIENNGQFYPRKILESYMNNKGYKLYARIGTSDDIYIPIN